MTLIEDLQFIKDSVDDRRDIDIVPSKLWGWTIVMCEDGYGTWEKTTARLEDVVKMVVDEISERDN